MAHEHTHYIDHGVVNQDLEKIGTVTDVLYDDDVAEPKWLVVKLGALQPERYVPIKGSYETDDGRVVVPFDKRWVKAAPKAGDHIMSREIERAAAEHYGVDN